MTTLLTLHPDRLFSAHEKTRDIARHLYQKVKTLPIISPHGHTDPSWFANNQNFMDATELLIKPDHYVFRMLYSQGIPLQDLGIKSKTAMPIETDNRKIWGLFAKNYHLFRGTPSRLWFDSTFCEIFGFTDQLCAETADDYYDKITATLQTDAFKPQTLFKQLNIEVLATTESPLNDLRHHQKIQNSDWSGKVITTFRPDCVVDPDFAGFSDNVLQLGQLTDVDTSHWHGYLEALKSRREFFKTMGATASDHGHPTAATADLTEQQCIGLFNKVLSGTFTANDSELFRAQMLTEMATMSLHDGLVMQLHPGSFRNHNKEVFTHFGTDKGADIPLQVEYVKALKPLLDKYGNDNRFTLIVFTLDETTYARELAPLAGHYPCLKLGPAWWFNDSPEGMRRFRRQVTETAGFYNTVGFNDDTRAFLSIPARHDVARRVDSNFLAELVCEHSLSLEEAEELSVDLAYNLAKQTYNL